MKSQNRRIAETRKHLRRLATSILLLKQGLQEQVAQDSAQLHFECLQGWRHHRLSGQPVPPSQKKWFFSHVQMDTPVFQFVLSCHWVPLRRVCLCFLHSSNSSRSLSLSLYERSSSSLIIFMALCAPHMFVSLSYWGPQNWKQSSRYILPVLSRGEGLPPSTCWQCSA